MHPIMDATGSVAAWPWSWTTVDTRRETARDPESLANDSEISVHARFS